MLGMREPEARISVPRCRDCVNGGRISVAGCGNSVWRDFSRGRRRAECGRISVARRSRSLGEGGGRERMEDLTGLGAGEGRSLATEGRGLARAHGREKEPWRVKCGIEMICLNFYFFFL
ncbi:Uncharacterized protein Fot_10013 [Forsythia ovata]|uniref:Uncharacterized protein n=1 Tax=Forsythia ovata TaxID=205694 RepID=A0ABD1WI72_9LAMI